KTPKPQNPKTPKPHYFTLNNLKKSIVVVVVFNNSEQVILSVDTVNPYRERATLVEGHRRETEKKVAERISEHDDDEETGIEGHQY
ncbi:MAG: hypothetical protein ACKO96_23035, partial [Flammeovirgaceae bacterium]